MNDLLRLEEKYEEASKKASKYYEEAENLREEIYMLKNGIKRCPFCGSAPRIIDRELTGRYDVTCEYCKTTMEGYTSRERIIAAWNRRVGDEEQIEHGDDLETWMAYQNAVVETEEANSESMVHRTQKLST